MFHLFEKSELFLYSFPLLLTSMLITTPQAAAKTFTIIYFGKMERQNAVLSVDFLTISSSAQRYCDLHLLESH